jgi:hypothetical protein
MAFPRYAICFAPEQGSALEAVAHAWFGRDSSGTVIARQSAVAGVSRERIEQLTRMSASFGMHGTLKPPFELMPHATEKGLLTVAEVIAKSWAPFEIPPLELGEVGFIISLMPESSSTALENLATMCVRAFDGFRLPLSEAEEHAYKRRRLTVHQRQMLEHWGYPYVMEEFDFHLSMTDYVHDDTERAAIMKAVEAATAPVLHKPLIMRELTVFRQKAADAPMSIIARFPFGRRV